MANILMKVVHILGPPRNVVVAEALGDGFGSSASPSSFVVSAAEATQTEEEGGSSYATTKNNSTAHENNNLSGRPPLALAPRKRTRAQTKTAVATGGEVDVIDFTIGRENEPNVDDAASRVDVTAEGAEGENQYSPYVLEDLSLNQWLMVIDNLEINRAVRRRRLRRS
ncbi:hypothetical protein Dimus_003099 [Dionaea muscipula]